MLYDPSFSESWENINKIRGPFEGDVHVHSGLSTWLFESDEFDSEYESKHGSYSFRYENFDQTTAMGKRFSDIDSIDYDNSQRHNLASIKAILKCDPNVIMAKLDNMKQEIMDLEITMQETSLKAQIKDLEKNYYYKEAIQVKEDIKAYTAKITPMRAAYKTLFSAFYEGNNQELAENIIKNYKHTSSKHEPGLALN
jgi:hypothetical protein